ncbi:hypothetical protein HK19_15440 [Acetobacter persici]|nr:hypothetical protein HK19_15440 [Acetobacter persici]
MKQKTVTNLKITIRIASLILFCLCISFIYYQKETEFISLGALASALAIVFLMICMMLLNAVNKKE